MDVLACAYIWLRYQGGSADSVYLIEHGAGLGVCLKRHPLASYFSLWLQLGASPSVMFGEDLPWYAKGISNQHSRAVSDRQRRPHDSRGVRKSIHTENNPCRD